LRKQCRAHCTLYCSCRVPSSKCALEL